MTKIFCRATLYYGQLSITARSDQTLEWSYSRVSTVIGDVIRLIVCLQILVPTNPAPTVAPTDAITVAPTVAATSAASSGTVSSSTDDDTDDGSQQPDDQPAVRSEARGGDDEGDCIYITLP